MHTSEIVQQRDGGKTSIFMSFVGRYKYFQQFVVLSFTSANYHRILPTLADRVPAYVDFINSPQNETIQLIYTTILFFHLFTQFITSYLYF